jgi:hypothetical protein
MSFSYVLEVNVAAVRARNLSILGLEPKQHFLTYEFLPLDAPLVPFRIQRGIAGLLRGILADIGGYLGAAGLGRWVSAGSPTDPGSK